jgi:hypothetical protein
MLAKSGIRIALALGLLLAGTASVARITHIDFERVESPTFGGASFGNVGQYEKLVGRAYGELDPRDPANRDIVYIDKAPRNAAGRVEYSFDVYILKPVDMSRGNRTVFYDVVNRGDQRAFAVFHVGANTGNNPVTEKDAGDGFFLKQGYTIVASGWQGDVTGGSNRVTGQYPVVKERDGSPITKELTAELAMLKPVYTLGLAFDGERQIRAYPAVAARMAEARMYRRSAPLGERVLIPRSEWSFGTCPTGKEATPSNVDVCYPAGFSPDYLYDVVYVAQDPVVMGIGFASTRDLISFLRRERTDANPAWGRGGARDGGDPLKWAIGFGRSQSGRYIKDLVNEGFNVDEGRRIVFDGILPLVSGSRLTNTNKEFAVPNKIPSTLTSHFYGGDEFPHSYATVDDPITKKRGGWLARCTAQNACPKIMHWDTASEAYGARHSLVVADGLGKANLPIPENVRVYFLPGTQHVPTSRAETGICKHLQNPNPYRETLRALLVAMRGWIVDGAAPPPSRYASIADGTLVPPLPVEKFGFPKIPGVVYTGLHSELHIKDFSVQPPRNIPGTDYTVLVSKIDADGNDIAGVRSVMLQVPLGTYTGWNQRVKGQMEDQFCGNPGAFFPFAKTAADRGADPRPSLQERYGSHANYVAKVEAAAAKLVAERYLLPDDAARLVTEARNRDLGF